jgi:hypothetical protein
VDLDCLQAALLAALREVACSAVDEGRPRVGAAREFDVDVLHSRSQAVIGFNQRLSMK